MGQVYGKIRLSPGFQDLSDLTIATIHEDLKKTNTSTTQILIHTNFETQGFFLIRQKGVVSIYPQGMPPPPPEYLVVSKQI